MSSSILIIHTQEQLEQASNLVDLLESALSVPDGTIACSSLPGYSWSDRGGSSIPYEGAVAVIALVDESAFNQPQLWFDLAAAWSTGCRVAVLVDSLAMRLRLPTQLRVPDILIRRDSAALRALVEDVAFDIGVDPRLSREALRVLAQLSTSADDDELQQALAREPVPARREPAKKPATRREPAFASKREPAFAEHDATSVQEDAPPARFALAEHDAPSGERRAITYAEVTSLPSPLPRLPEEPLDEARFDGSSAAELYESIDASDELEPLPEPTPIARLSQPVSRMRCETALEAGRAIAECSFHREDGGDQVAELAEPLGRFIDAIGGRWDELSRLGDVELWLGATDNLLEGLPSSAREISEWYEIGFQYATLKCIAEQGMPEDDPEAHAVYEEMWNRAMQQLWESAATAQLPSHETRRVQSQLENVIGPAAYRDYSNLGSSLATLREMARNADRPGNRYARLAAT